MMNVLIADDESSVVELVRATLEDERVRVVAAADVRRGLDAGATEYLTKPFSPVRLLTLVDALAPGVLAWQFR